MDKKKLVYGATAIALPPLKMVLSDLPEPDPGQTYRPFNGNKEEVKDTVRKLIGHIKDNQ